MDRGYSTFHPLAFFLVLTMVAACAPVTQGPPLRALSDRQVATVLSTMEEQKSLVSSFYSLGRLTVGTGYWEPESNVLIAGTKEPFRIKIEITHPWGQPLVHILIDGDRLGVISFADKKLFLGRLTDEALARFLAGRLDSRLVWAALRGYPAPPEHRRVESREANRIVFVDTGSGETEILEVSPENLLPKEVILVDRQVKVIFSDFQEEHGIRYADEVKVIPPKAARTVALKREKAVFNRPIPEQVFELSKPAGFGVIDLDKEKGPPSW